MNIKVNFLNVFHPIEKAFGTKKYKALKSNHVCFFRSFDPNEISRLEDYKNDISRQLAVEN